jgi:hypothetical protein
VAFRESGHADSSIWIREQESRRTCHYSNSLCIRKQAIPCCCTQSQTSSVLIDKGTQSAKADPKIKTSDDACHPTCKKVPVSEKGHASAKDKLEAATLSFFQSGFKFHR